MEKRYLTNRLDIDGFQYITKKLYIDNNEIITLDCKHRKLCPDVKIKIKLNEFKRIIDKSLSYEYQLLNLHRCERLPNNIKKYVPKANGHDYGEKMLIDERSNYTD